jgi:hypothetical protein
MKNTTLSPEQRIRRIIGARYVSRAFVLGRRRSYDGGG